jgi:hypothetical protein
MDDRNKAAGPSEISISRVVKQYLRLISLWDK